MTIRTIRRIVLFTLAGCAVLTALILFLAHTSPARRYAISRIEALVGAGALHVSDLDYNLLAGTAELRGVTLGTAPRPFLTIARITADLDMAALLRGGAIVVDRAGAEGVAVDYFVDAQGQSNLPDFGPGDGGPPSNQLPDFLIRQLNAGGRFNLEDQVNQVAAQLPAWTLGIAGQDGPRHTVTFAMGTAGSVTYQSRVRALDTLALTAQVTRDRLTVDQLRAAIQGLTLDVAGAMNGFADPDLDMRVNLGLDVEPVLAFAGVSPPAGLAGHLDAAANLTNPISRLAVEAQVAGANLSVDRLRQVALDAQARWNLTDRVVEITSARVQNPEGAIALQATWAGTGAMNRASAQIERLDLSRVSKLFALPVEIASGATGTVEAQWQGLEFEAGTARANVRVTPARAAARDVLPLGGTVSIDVRNREVRIAARSVEALGAAAEADVVTHFQRLDLAGSLRVRVADAGAALTAINTFRGAAAFDQPVAGQAELRAQLGGTFVRPTATVMAEGSGIRYGPLQNLALNADASYDPAQVAVREARVTWNSSEVRASGTVGLEGEQRPLIFSAQTTDVAIPDVLVALGYDYPVTGRVALQAQGQGTLEDPRVSASVQGHELVAYQETLGELASNVSFIGRTLTVESLRLDKPGNAGSLTATGSYHLDARSYVLNAQGTDIDLAGDRPVRGVVNLTASGAGTIENPAGDVNLTVRDLSVEDRMVGAVTGGVHVADRRATVTAEVPAFQLRAEAEASASAPYPTTVRVIADNTDLATIPGASLVGRVTANIEASGEPERWRDGQASVEIASASLETPIGVVQSAEPIRIAVANRVVELRTVRLSGAGSTLALSGSMPLEASGPPGAVHYEGHVDLAALAETAAENANFTATGTVDLAGDVTGTLARLTPTGRIEVHDGGLTTPALRSPVEKVEVQAAINGGILAIERLQAALGTGIVNGQGSIPLGLFPLPAQLDVPAMTQPARVQASLTGLDLHSIAELPDATHGTVTLTVEAQADRPQLEAVNATVTIQQAILGVSGLRVQTAATPPVIALREGVLNIERFDLRGAGTEFHLSGGASIPDRQLRDVRVNGSINAGLLAGLSEGVSAAGDLNLQVAAAGSFTDPMVNGFVEMNDGRFSVVQPRFDAVGLNLRLALNGNRLEIERFQGDINGGMLTASGGIGFAAGIAPDIRLAASDMYLDFPEGLQTRSTTNLRLAPAGDNILLSGSVVLHEGAYTELIDLQTAFEGYMQSRGGGVELVEARNEFLNRLRFDVAVTSEDPILMDNNLGELAFAANLRIVGNYYRMGMTGRVDIQEDGRLRLQENEYVIERGVINFINEARIQPVLDIVANTQVRDRTISVTIGSDPAGDLTTALASDDPEDTQADIVALLLTGKEAEELEGGQMSAAGERAAASLVLGSLTGRLSQGLQSGLGLSRVRVEPDLISQESDPTARLTVGQDITRKLELIYSMNLRDSSDQILSTNYNILSGLNTRATQQSDNTYRFDFQHDLRFGARRVVAAPVQTPRAPRRVRSVTFTGDAQIPVKRLEDKFDVKVDKTYDFFRVRKGLDKLEDLYRDESRLEARLRLHREEPAPDAVALNVEIQAGPQVEFVFKGWESSGRLRDRVREQWARGVFDSQRIDLSADQVRLELARQGYLQPMIETEVQMPAEGRKRVLFTIERGERYSGVETVYRGASGIEPDVLKEQLKRAKMDDKIQSNPAGVRRFLAQYYQQQGFLDAAVTGPEYEFNEQERTAQVVLTIDEGARYRFGEVNVAGTTTFTADQIRTIAGIPAGTTFTPVGAQESRDKVEEEYWKKGYRDVVVDYTLARDAERGVVNVNVTVAEGLVSVVQAIDVEGNDRTTAEFVRRQIAFMTGDVLDYTKTADSRRHLYDTGAFSSVEIRTTPMENPDVANALKPVRLLATVQEPNPFRLRYGGFFDTERGPGFIADLRNRNSLGGGRTIGFRARYDNNVHEGRVFFSQPLLRSLPLRTDAATFVRREFQRDTLDDGTQEVFITDRIGFSAQEGLQLSNKFFLTFGYRFERAHTFDVDPEFIPFDLVLRVAPLTTSLTRDTRDELLDATRGSFTSQNFELSTLRLGSSFSFWRYFGQYFRYVPLTKPAPLPFGRGLEKPRVVYAGGVRVGLANAFGGQEELPRSERFFTGGGTTVRGFKQDDVGPKDIIGRSSGGEAMLIVNNELRFPVASIFDAVGFVDLGNVFTKIEDFRLTDIRKTGGAGLRVRTPYFLLRLDYGFKLDRKVDESRGAFFFSIGQAF